MLLGLSNGYLTTRSIVLAPTLVEEADREFASFLMYFFLLGGIFIGNVVSAFGVSRFF